MKKAITIYIDDKILEESIACASLCNLELSKFISFVLDYYLQKCYRD